MVNLPAKLGHLLHPSSRPQSPQPESPRSQKSRAIGISSACRSKTASSCELFGMLKAMAAGGNTLVDSDPDVVDLDEEEAQEQMTPLAPALALPRGSEATIIPHQSSSTTIKETVSEPTEQEQRELLEKWMQDSLGKADLQRESLSSRFAALSMSNLSPFVSGQQQDERHVHRPELPAFRPESQPESDIDSESLFSLASTSITTPSEVTQSPDHPDILGTENIPEAEKLQAIVDDFGDIAGLMEPAEGQSSPEPERILAESKGSLFKGVMLIGNLHLTTHRLLFHALLPPDAAFPAPQNPSEEGADAAYASATHQSDVLMAGPVTLHRSARLRAARRVWMELSAEMITWYPSGDETGRVRPLRSILLSSVHRMEPFQPDAPCDFHISFATPTGTRSTSFTIDTEQSAVQWRRELEGALFRHARRRWRENNTANPEDGWSTMRCCIPLDRVTIHGIDDYHNFATLVSLDIDNCHERVGQLQETPPVDETRASDSEPDVRHKRASVLDKASRFGQGHTASNSSSREASPSRRGLSLRQDSNSSTPGHTPHSPVRRETSQYIDSSLPPRLSLALNNQASGYKVEDNFEHTYNFNVAVLNEQSWFAKALQAAVHAAQDRRYRIGIERPRMSLTVGGYDCLKTDEDLEQENSRGSLSSEDLEGEEGQIHSLGQDIRKAEKASMAARIFGLREDEGIWLKRCYVTQGLIPSRGHIILTPRYICFWRRATIGADIKYRFPAADIKGAEAGPSLRAAFHGMLLNLHGHSPVRFEFWSEKSRDEVIAKIRAICTHTPLEAPQDGSTNGLSLNESVLHIERTATPLEYHAADILAPPKHAMFESRAFPDEALSYMPFVANKPYTNTSRLTSRHFVCLTIGSRGDVQPYIALGLRLKKDGHRVTIVTHDEFKSWIEGYGIGHRQAGGDPTALMKLSAEHKMFSPGFFKESLGSFRQWLDDLLLDSWTACKDADVLIESPSAMAGVHIAEALKIPYFRAFTMPWTRTTAYPQAFMVPAFEMGPSFNYSTYVLFDNIMWRATSGQINRWRKKHLALKATDMSSLSITKVNFLYNFSPSVVPKPLDWHDDITITGYWNLEDSDTEWTPPPELEAFMQKAKDDSKPLVYIGFGSIVVPRPNAMTKSIISAVEKADVRAIIAKGWSSRGANPAEEGGDIQFPANCYGLDKVPHSWLFPRVDAALHHGGAGTVGASLRAGIPTLIKPWFGDQFFWAVRVTKLEVGLKVSSLRSDDIADALKRATTDRVMIEKAARIGARIRSENGVEKAIQAIHYNIGRAASDRTKMQWAK